MSKLVFRFLVWILIHQILSIPDNGAKNLFTKIVYNQISATITQEVLSNPRATASKTCSSFFCDGPKYLYKFIALLPKDYYLIPSNNVKKLVHCVPYLLY